MNLQQEIRSRLLDILKNEFTLTSADIQFSIPPDRKLGDLSTTLPFVLAKRLGEKPFAIGQRIREAVAGKFHFFSDIRLAGGGFLNFYFDRDFLFSHLWSGSGVKPPPTGQKVIVEHTSINPNKAAHIGHLRNACLGDALAHTLTYLGYDVEVQNYIDDTGIQVADVVWGLIHHERLGLDEVIGIAKRENLANYLWGLYARVHRMMDGASAEVSEQRKQVHKDIENKNGTAYAVGDYVAQEVLRDHVRVMNEIGVRYDLMVRESDIIALNFFSQAADLMKQEGVMYLSSDTEKSGCWVVKYHREDIEKIIVRSNDTITYIGKDIAYTLWKVGLLPGDFRYRPFFKYGDGRVIHMSASDEGEDLAGFGRASRVYNVIDTRQSYLQNIISQVLHALAGEAHGERFMHFSYEMVALTPRCVRELGFALSEEDTQKSYVEVSGRKGIAVKAEDLIRKLTEKSLEEVRSRHPDLEIDAARKIAREIAVGALRYFMVKFNSNSVIAFDFTDALAFEGDTGPYLQYTRVRLNSILNKLERSWRQIVDADVVFNVLDEDEAAVFYDILLHLLNMEPQISFAIESQELSVITSYIYALCQKFNHYYHLFPILAEKRSPVKKARIALVLLVRDRLDTLLGLMGIPVPEKM